MSKVSILLNCYNGELYLKETLDSIYAQTHQDWEIIFVDNASTDKTAEIAHSYDHRLRYFNTQENLPLYSARNVGLQQVTGDFIAIVDSDDVWFPEKLQKQLLIMEKYPEVYLCCTGYFIKNENNGTIKRSVSQHLNFISFHEAINSYPINVSTVMIRRDEKSVSKIQFQPLLNLTGDYELFAKLVYYFKGYYIAEPLITYRFHTTNLSKKLKNDWPREILETHARWERELALTPSDRLCGEKRHARASAFMHLASGDYKAARFATQKYFLKDKKLSALFLASFNRFLAKQLLKLRGF